MPTSNLPSYKQVSIARCLAKFFEHLTDFRLTCFLKVNGPLALEHTSFHPHLAAQRSLLHLVSDAEEDCATHNYVLVAFSDVQ